ncbi:MAG TPA: GIY-YIG nuclease family protein [Flavisolibacter sp.]|nr:GIY-YIG nuclease family protein [Flavisolibacter sp.]
MKSQKELKNEYKSAKPKMGIFQIKNQINGKIYIDSSTNLEAIWNRHKTELKFGGHRNEGLQKEWNEFGEEHFTFDILSELTQKEEEMLNYTAELKELKAMYVEELQPFGDKGYNKA